MDTDPVFNISLNTTFQISETVPAWIAAIKLMRTTFVPVIVTVGLFGNTLSLLVFSGNSMKKSSCSVFLASLAFVDNIFLLSLLLTWIDAEIYVILTIDIACQVLIFTTYVTSFLSVWFIVCFTCERFIAICFPLKSSYMCSVFREKRAVFIFTILAGILYNFSFWTTGMEQWGPHMRCSHKIKYFHFLHIVTWVDTSLTMIFPFVIIAVMNTMVLRSVIQCPLGDTCCQLGDMCITSSQRNKFITDESSSSMTKDLKITAVSVRSGVAQRRNPQLRVTRTLLFVSTTFLVLNLPSHTIRLYNLIRASDSDTGTISVQYSFVQEVTLILYYTTFACNFFLYTLFGRNFKTSLYFILRCRSTTDNQMNALLRTRSSSRHKCATAV